LSRVAEEGIPLSVICVYLGGNKKVINYIAHTGDIFGARKVKILTTIPKGMSRNLFEDFTTGEELDQLHDHLQAEKQRNGWTPRITIADWMRIGPGHAILIEPDGELHAEVLGALKYHRADKAGRYGAETLGGELADVMVCLALLAQILDVDLTQAVTAKIDHLEARNQHTELPS
jgi:NTP pyrophosphatase (non-canonical NTP hydrolase)